MAKNEKKPNNIGVILIVLSIVCMFISMRFQTGTFSTLFFLLGSVLLIVGIIMVLVNAGRKRRMKRQNAPAITPQPASVATPAPTVAAAPAPAQAPRPEKKAAKTERIHVRGVGNYKENILSVALENPDYDMTKKELVEEHPDERVWQYDFHSEGTLVPEPDNEYDPNAIMVQADGLCIGYVPKGSTAHVRKLMESGRIQSIWLKIGGGKYRGVYENEDGAYELDIGEKDFSAVVELIVTEE